MPRNRARNACFNRLVDKLKGILAELEPGPIDPDRMERRPGLAWNPVPLRISSARLKAAAPTARNFGSPRSPWFPQRHSERLS